MRKIEDLKTDEMCAIINKIKDTHVVDKIKKLDELYLEETEYGDILFIDGIIALEPSLKGEIRRRHISEDEMDCFIEFYGSATNVEDI